MPTPVELTETALATHRVTRLIVEDRITRAPRRIWIKAAYHNHTRSLENAELHEAAAKGVWEDVVDLDKDPPLAATWAVCPWCAGMWVSAAVTLLNAADRKWWRLVRRLLALSSAAGLIAGHETP